MQWLWHVYTEARAADYTEPKLQWHGVPNNSYPDAKLQYWSVSCKPFERLSVFFFFFHFSPNDSISCFV